MNDSSIQFTLRFFLSLVSLLAVAISIDMWILTSDQLATHRWFPFFYPPLTILKLSMVGGPVLAAAMLLTASIFWFRTRPIVLMPILFFALIPVLFMVPPSAIMRLFVAMLVATTTIFVEALFRSTSNNGYVVGICCLIITFCFYMFISSANASISV